jgi:N-acyl-D-amino-acid deacylase
MTGRYDLLIRGGTIVDGSGDEPYVADLGVLDGRIVAIGTLEGDADDLIEAEGLTVTPGFIDVHTHYDGQAVWSNRLAPSSAHGVTTVIIGNCGVGFAPCRKEDHDTLVRVMEGVEDIPGVVMVEGLDWSWETFPQFLDVLDSRPRDIDIAAYLPHNPLRVYAMGDRGARREKATADDLAQMRQLACEAMKAGAIGFATDRVKIHVTADKQQIPSYEADIGEIEEIVRGMVDGGGGLIQFMPDVPIPSYRGVIEPMIEISKRTGQPLTFSLAKGYDSSSSAADEALEMCAEASRMGPRVMAQIFPRPIGLVFGLELSSNPFSLCPSYIEIADLPLEERVALMRDPEMRRRLITEAPSEGNIYLSKAREWDWMFPLAEWPNYEPSAADSVAGRAKAHGVTPEEEVYDLLLQNDGHTNLLVALGNFPDHSLDGILDMIKHPNAVIGLGDGGAHYALICDASFPTSVLAHWVRDRAGERIPLPSAIKSLTSIPADLMGLGDRGLLKPGYKADINVFDLPAVRLKAPRVVYDLPAGGKRLDQEAEGFVATIVSGKCIARNGKPTGSLPGRLIRGRQAQPA